MRISQDRGKTFVEMSNEEAREHVLLGAGERPFHPGFHGTVFDQASSAPLPEAAETPGGEGKGGDARGILSALINGSLNPDELIDLVALDPEAPAQFTPAALEAIRGWHLAKKVRELEAFAVKVEAGDGPSDDTTEWVSLAVPQRLWREIQSLASAERGRA